MDLINEMSETIEITDMKGNKLFPQNILIEKTGFSSEHGNHFNVYELPIIIDGRGYKYDSNGYKYLFYWIHPSNSLKIMNPSDNFINEFKNGMSDFYSFSDIDDIPLNNIHLQ